MKISIVIPVYKVEPYLRQCIDSVLAQSFKDYEIILVDDGSPDACPGICDDYASADRRVKVVHKANGGLSDARNSGLDKALGDYIIFLDSDDWWDDSCFLEKLNRVIETTCADIVIFGMKKYFSSNGKFGDVRLPQKAVGEDTLSVMRQYMRSNTFVACACDKIVRRSVIENKRLRFVRGQFSEDIEWCANLLLSESAIEVLEEAPYVYRQQVGSSITANVGTKNIRSILDVVGCYANKDAFLPLLHFMANQYVLLMTNLMRLPKYNRRWFEKEIKSYWWLLNYDWYPYVKKVGAVKFMGYDITKTLLRLYYLARR